MFEWQQVHQDSHSSPCLIFLLSLLTLLLSGLRARDAPGALINAWVSTGNTTHMDVIFQGKGVKRGLFPSAPGTRGLHASVLG
jgi:hypothetical protein